MIDLNEIEETIDKFVNTRDTSFYACSRLADMFIVMDHLKASKEADLTTQRMSGSEFLEACSDVPYPALMQILDEHVSALRVVQPREYEALITRIRALR